MGVDTCNIRTILCRIQSSVVLGNFYICLHEKCGPVCAGK